MTNLDSIFKSRDITLPTKVRLVKVWSQLLQGQQDGFLLIYESESHSVVSDSLRPHGLYSPQNSPGQNTGVSGLCLLQEIFPTQGLNPGLPHCRQTLYHLSHQEVLVTRSIKPTGNFWLLPTSKAQYKSLMAT